MKKEIQEGEERVGLGERRGTKEEEEVREEYEMEKRRLEEEEHGG